MLQTTKNVCELSEPKIYLRSIIENVNTFTYLHGIFSITFLLCKMKISVLNKMHAKHFKQFVLMSYLRNMWRHLTPLTSKVFLVKLNFLCKCYIWSRHATNSDLAEYRIFGYALGRTAECSAKDVCIYKWWPANSKAYPILTKFAKIYLSSPGSSVYSERLFSEASIILIFMKKNAIVCYQQMLKKLFLFITTYHW